MPEETHPPEPRGIEPNEQVVTTTDGLSVKKTVERHEDDVAKVVFEVQSNLDEPGRLRIVDEIPDEVDAETVGFHPEYQPEQWQVDDEARVVFEAVIEPGAALETIYGIRIDSVDELELFLEEPSVAVERDAPGDSASTRDRTPVSTPEHNGLANGEGEYNPAASAVPTAVSNGDNGDGSTESKAPDSSASTDDLGGNTASPDETPVPTSPPSGSAIVEALVEALERGDLTDEQRTTIINALQMEPLPSLSARVQHLQTEVDDLAAYRGALREFIDEHGTGDGIVDRLQADIDDLRSELEGLAATVASNTTQLADIESRTERIGEMETSIDRLDDELETLSGTVTSFRADYDDRIRQLDDRLDEMGADRERSIAVMEDELDTLRDDLEQEREWRQNLRNALGVEPTSFEF